MEANYLLRRVAAEGVQCKVDAMRETLDLPEWTHSQVRVITYSSISVYIQCLYSVSIFSIYIQYLYSVPIFSTYIQCEGFALTLTLFRPARTDPLADVDVGGDGD